MRPSAQRFSSLMIAAGMIVAAIVVFFLLIKPSYGTLQVVRGEVEGLTSIVNGQQAALKQVQDIQAKYQSQKDEFKRTIAEMLPIGAQESEAFNHVAKLAEINHLALKSVSVTASAIEQAAPSQEEGSAAQNILKPFGTMTFQLQLVGTYEDFQNILKNIETNVRIMTVDSVNITTAGKPNEDIYSFDISVVVYYQTT